MGDRGKRLGNIIYHVGKILAAVITAGLFLYFIINPFLILFNSPAGLGIQLIIPGITMDFKVALLFIIPFILVIIPHEIAHAVMARREGLDIQSSGIFFLIFLFGAFVELSKESLDNAKSKKKIKVWLNGSAVNAVIALFFVALFFLSPFIIKLGYNPSNGVLITDIHEGFPADIAGIKEGNIIQSIAVANESIQNSIFVDINNVQDYDQFFTTYLNASLLYISLFNNSIIETIPTNTNPITNTNSTTKLFLGVSIYDFLPPKSKRLSIWFPYYWDIEVLYTLNLSIMAVFLNMLPLGITDGDKILSEYLKIKKYDEVKSKKALKIIRIISIALILLNIVLSMIKFSW
ncbi:MAG: site-2 protease family protein [Candidatus Heimdallarchaeaceae archaeon]